MTLQEILKANGIAEDVITKIQNDMKSNKIFTSAEENIDIRYGKLKEDFDALTTKDGESQKLIASLQEATKGQESIQSKIKEYETTVETLNKELVQAKTESALKLGLLAKGAKASDIDYLIFKMSHDNDWKPELDGDGKIKGLDDKVTGLKTQFPSQFESSTEKKIAERKLDKGGDDKAVTPEEFKKMGYSDRVKLFNENPDLYHDLQK